jgi:hypothetical protein
VSVAAVGGTKYGIKFLLVYWLNFLF